jgi:Protein of unknown function (DUF4232)
VAIAGGAIWAGVALSSGRAGPAIVAVATPRVSRPPVAASSSTKGSPVIAAASPSGAAPPSSPAAVPSPFHSVAPVVTVCRSDNLQVTNPSGFESGMGGSTVEIVFQNIGSQSCSLVGWPAVSTPGMRTKVQYQTTTGAGFMVPVSRIVLAPGDSGDAALDLFGAPGSTYSQACFAAGSWAVTLPGSRQSALVPWPKYQGACPGGTVEVSPFYIPDPESVTGFSSADPASISQLGPFDSPPTVP